MITEQTKQVLKGCGDWDDTTLVGFQRDCNKKHLCSSCQKAKQTLKQSYEEEVKFLETLPISQFRAGSESYGRVKKRINQLNESIKELE